ncbi:MAG: DEAD/DEAH box helicase family protein [Alphaproteobacteria bacterium]|nr:DEAD/DEAH box helicase family protein [Alphaproteobacteria bacterium]
MTQQQENFNALINGLARILSDSEKVSTLRPSQQKVLRDFIQSPEQFKTGIFDLATAFGKTRIMALLADAYHQNAPHQIIIAEPTRELVGQIATELSTYFSDTAKVGQFFSEKKDTTHPILVTTYSSLDKLAHIVNPQNVGLLLLDEGHHAVSDKRMEIVRRFSNACQYGMTATPDYSEDRTLKNLLHNTIAHVDIRQGIHDGILSPFSNIVLFSTFQLDLSQVKRVGGSGDYDIEDYRQAFAKALSPVHLSNTSDTDWKNAHRKIAHEIALFYQSMVPHKKHCLINCHTQEEAKIQAEEINKVFGKPTAGVWTSNTQKTAALSDFESGKLGVLCQVGMLQEGYDFPALDLCINYPTASPVRATQRGGRTLRLDPDNPDKQATIVDIVFSFPGSHNPYTSARKNNQVLYSDVVQAIYVAPKTINRRGLIQSPAFPKVAPLHLNHFRLVSDTKTLLTLKHQDRQQEASEYVPFKQDGMLTAKEFADKFGGTPDKYMALFHEIYADKSLNTCMDDNNQPFQLISLVRSGSSRALCLSNHPEALDFFSKICKEKYQKRNSNKISLEEYAKGHYLSQEDLFNICSFLSSFKFKTLSKDGNPHVLIARHQVKKDVLLLEDTEDARQDLHALISLTDYLRRVPKMPDDMCDLGFFENTMALDKDLVTPIIKRAILEGKTFKTKDGQEKPLAQFYRVTDDFTKQDYYGICVPKDIDGQEALLKLLGYRILHQVTTNISEICKSRWRWNLYKQSRNDSLPLRKRGAMYNLSGSRISQILLRVKQDLHYALSCLELKRTGQRPSFFDKLALRISDGEDDILVTQSDLLRSNRNSRATANSINLTDTRRIILWDHSCRSRND